MNEYCLSRPDIYPSYSGEGDFPLVEPERFPVIAQGLVDRGYSKDQVKGILGHNNLRIGRQVWK